MTVQKRKRLKNIPAEHTRPTARSSAGGSRNVVTLLTFLAGILYLIRRIPLINIIGDEGNAYFAIAFDTYTFFLILCAYAAPEAVSRMTALRRSKGQYRNMGKVMRTAMILTLMSAVFSGGVFYLFSDFIAETILQQPLCGLSMKILAPVLVLMGAAGIFRGCFQGMGTMVPTVLSGILEELLILILSLVFAAKFMEHGSKVGALLRNSRYEAAFGAAGASLGVLVAAIVVILLLFLIFMVFRVSFKQMEQKDMGRGPETGRRVGQVLVMTSMPLMLIALLCCGSLFVDQLMYLRLADGADKLVLWGIFTGKCRIILSVPIVIACGVCTVLVPLISLSYGNSSMGRAQQKSNTLFKISVMIGLPAAVWTFILSSNSVMALFSKGDMETAAQYLKPGSLYVLFLLPALSLTGILAGYGRLKQAILNTLIALLIHTLVLFLMLGQFSLGIPGVIYANILMAVLLFIFNLLTVLRLIRLRFDWPRILYGPLIGTAVSSLILFIVQKMFGEKLGSMALYVVSLIIGIMVYVILNLSFRSLNERELRELPGGFILIGLGRLLRVM